MSLTQVHRTRFTQQFCILFYLLFLYKIFNGQLLYQVRPFLFNTRLDLATFIVMQTGVHRWLLNNATGQIIFDVIFYLMPFLYWLAYRKNIALASITATIMLLVNFIYIECYTLYPGTSIEGFISWLLFPLAFMTVNLNGFYFVMNGLRYFLLYFFVSAGVWKFVQGGIFNLNEMSGILLVHHQEYLASSSGAWYTSLIFWLVNHPFVSYCIYLAATLLELSFLIGFFTKKTDKFLVVALLLFLLTDHFIMRIPYWEISPFILTLLFSQYSLPVSDLSE